MKNDRRLWLKGLAALPLAASLPARADALARVRQQGRLRVAVYRDFAPYSLAGGKGIDADLGRALAARLGVAADIVAYTADEDMSDDLRNMVWKGHYLGAQPSDVMMHVPVDEHLARANDKVRIFGPYHRETLALARDPQRLGAVAGGSAAVALEVFTREKIGVETASLADSFLLTVLNGRLRDNVVHFKTVAEATRALRDGQVAAVLAPRAELESALAAQSRLVLDTPKFAELRPDSWPLGMAGAPTQWALAEALTAALAELRRDGTVTEILRRHGITHSPV